MIIPNWPTLIEASTPRKHLWPHIGTPGLPASIGHVVEKVLVVDTRCCDLFVPVAEGSNSLIEPTSFGAVVVDWCKMDMRAKPFMRKVIRWPKDKQEIALDPLKKMYLLMHRLLGYNILHFLSLAPEIISISIGSTACRAFHAWAA